MRISDARVIIGRVLRLYVNRKLPGAAAAMAYYLTMTLFPLIICLYALFGRNRATFEKVYGYIEQFLTPNANELFQSFLEHVAGSGGMPVLLAAILILVKSASAAMRTLEGTISDMQGGRRFRAVPDLLLSFVLAAALLLAVYFSFVALLAGEEALRWIDRQFSLDLTSQWWLSARFMLLGGFALMALWGAFSFARRRDDGYPALPGAALSTLAIVVIGALFSKLITSSARYSLVYGSLASLILLMLWLYLACQAVLVGAALNIALGDRRSNKQYSGNHFRFSPSKERTESKPPE